ncbi:MAG TPA: ACT domain-containing protein [Candidatus Nanoarchaeia archaeon]|nr:ACT domain-containing protein [Candidatus Nanoarchaeia archaeon]
MPIKDLDQLMRSMKPELIKGEFIFCSVSDKQLAALKVKPLMAFKEKEGITLILHRKDAEVNSIKYEGVWVLITMTVHSDLAAVGFLARLTNALAKEGISVNAVSAFYHDHLFVPKEKSKEAMKILKRLSS